MDIIEEKPPFITPIADVKESERDTYLDLLRGIMLIVMTIDHNGGPLNKVFYQTIGFVTAAEGFVYLSGVVFGLVYSKRIIKGFSSLFKTAAKRSLVIYFYHMLLIAVLTMPIWSGLLSQQALANSVFLSPFLSDFTYKLFLYSIFLYQPHLMDILPMYCLFILAAPFVLNAFSKNRITGFFILSGALWLFSQFNFFKLKYPEYGIDLGSFNIFAWQFLFFAGVYIGHLRFRKTSLIPVTKTIFVFAAIIALVLFAINMFVSFEYIRLPEWLVSKPNLGILRVVNFFALAYSINYLIKSGIFFRARWISFLGQHSLQVFIFHIFCVFLIDFVRHKLHLESPITDIGFSLIAVVSLLIPAYIHDYACKRFPLVKKLGL